MVFLHVYRKCSRLVKSSWSMICSREKLPPSHLAAAAATSPPSQPVSTGLFLCWAAATPPQPSATAVPRLWRDTASLCSVHWPLTQPYDRSWSSRVSFVSSLSITCGEEQQPWGRRCASWSVSSPGAFLEFCSILQLLVLFFLNENTVLFFCKTKPRWDVVHLNTQWIIIFPCNLCMFLPQRSSRGHSTDEWPHHCQSIRCSERSLGQSWPGTTSSLFFLNLKKIKRLF